MDLRTQLESALGSSFRIIRELGGGGMSRVFLAEDIEHGREIVVKVVPGDLAGQVNVDRFRREIKVAAKLQHPCIVPVLSSGSADGLPYYTMPFVEGESLRARLTRERGLSVQESIRILRDICGAVAYAHEHGVVHRDIKPDNILVTRHHAVLLDFGVAKALTESTRGEHGLTSVGVALGTPAYMAPEQAAADPSVDHRADIYSLGIVAYEMLAGRHPFEGRSPQSMLAAHAVENPNTISVHRPQLPAVIAGLVMRMLEKHPGDRPQSAEEVLAALDQVTTPTTTTVSGEKSQQRNGNVRRKRLLLAGAAGGAVITLAGLSLFAFRTSGGGSAALDSANVLVMTPVVRETSADSMKTESERITDALLRRLSEVPTAKLVNGPDQSADLKLSAGQAGLKNGAATVVASTMYKTGDSIEIQFKIVDAKTDRVIRTLRPSRIGLDLKERELRDALDPVGTVIGFVTEPTLGAVFIPPTVPAFAAFQDFHTAIQFGSEFDTASARQTTQLLRRAFERDTSFITARLTLAWWLRTTGYMRAYSPAADEFAATQVYVSDRRARLSPFEQVLADFVIDPVSTDRSLSALRKLIAMAPRNPYRSSFPNLLLNLNRPYAADSAFAQLLLGDTSLQSNGSFWRGRAALYHYTGDYKKSLDAANHARLLAPSDISAFRPALTALAALGDTVTFNRMIEETAVASPSGTFFGFAGDIYLEAGNELIAHGNPLLGERILRRADAWFASRTPEQMRTSTIALRAALGYINQNQLDTAERILLARLSKVDPDVRFLGALGRIEALRGDTVAAERYMSRLAALPAERLSGTPTFERAQIAAELNRREQAVAFLRDAFAQGCVFSYRARLHWFSNFRRMDDYPPFRALITPQG